jgi:hypothetical protein
MTRQQIRVSIHRDAKMELEKWIQNTAYHSNY